MTPPAFVGRRGLILLASLLVLGLFWGLRETPEDAVLGSAQALTAAFAAPPDEVYGRVLRHVADPVRIMVAGWQQELTARQAAELAQSRRQQEGPRVLTLENPLIGITGRHARLDAMLISSESQPGDLHAAERRVLAEFEERDGWRLRSLRLGVAKKHLPEARP